MKFKTTYIFFFIVMTVAVIHSCKKNEDVPANPYDNINYGGGTPPDTTDLNSFAGIHKAILSVKCATPGCHDGSFEPDYRTVQSAYATLVYHPVVKKLSPWVYRVVPYDTANSWLWQRINHPVIISGSDTSQGQMPLYSTPLSTVELARISNWILNGAKDMFGQPATYPNTEPVILGYIALNNLYAAIDTNRSGGVFYNPFYIDTNYSFKILVALEDDSTLVSALQNNKIKFSSNRNNFSSATVFTNPTYVTIGTAKVWIFDVSSAGYAVGDTVFFRYYTNDGDHVTDTEFPRNDLIDPWKTWWSFIVQ